MSTRIAVAGAGLIGRRHAEALRSARDVALCAIVDPDPAAAGFAADHGVPCLPDLDALLARTDVDGVILALPNALHGPAALACIAAGLPVLVEKPLATNVAEGAAMVAAAKAAGVPLLTGHHRRYNPLITRAIEIVREGALGTLTAVQAQAWFFKPDRYFDTAWRRDPGAGPVFLNLIHDIDLLQALCGPVAAVQAMDSNALRGNPVEETAVVLLRFASGLLGTVNVSDAAVAPWSWELTARENPAYPATDQNCYWIAGTRGALALPNLALWTHDGPDGWWSPIAARRLPFGFDDPLVVQAAHFGAVIRGQETPRATGADGLSALTVIEAIKRAAASGRIERP